MSTLMQRYRALLPITSDTPDLSLGEGATPLLRVVRLARFAGVRELYVKVEGANPTGSFKDRGMVVAAARAVERGARLLLCASTGNTAASAAAYAARAGVHAAVLLPSGKVATGKLAQAMMYGARIVAVDANFDSTLDIARELASQFDVALVNSVNPDRIAGQSTAAYEICDTLGNAPDVLALPVGNGGNITAYAAGFRRYVEAGTIARLPRIFGCQAEGAAPFVHNAFVDNPESVATAIRIGRPATWEPAHAAARDSGGQFVSVSDAEILEAYRAAAALEGVFCEPASAASIAGLRASVRSGRIASDVQVVCVLTGNGLKDPTTALEGHASVVETRADVEQVAQSLGLLSDAGAAGVRGARAAKA